MDTDAARLRWRCRRGMRELDALLIRFVEEVYETLPAGDKRRFATLLELPDPDLHAYIVGRHEPPDPDLERLLDRIRACRPT